MICQRRPDRTDGELGPTGECSASSRSVNLQATEFSRPLTASPISLLNREHRVGVLSRVIEHQIVPAMLLGHNAQPADDLASAWEFDAEVDAFAQLILGNDLNACLAWIEDQRRRGVSQARLRLGLLSQTARRLGAWWDADCCSFVDVTVGVGMLQRLLHSIELHSQPQCVGSGETRRILLASLPGDRHAFGPQMVADAFVQAGWDVTFKPALAATDLAAEVERSDFTIAGLSIATRQQVEPLAQTIRLLRRHSANANIGIMVGGPLFLAWPDLPGLVGADVGAADAGQAVIRADGLRMLCAAIAPDHDRPAPLALGFGATR